MEHVSWKLCALTTNMKETAEWFHRAQPTGRGRQLGLSSPVRTETVNTAMAPALLSGTNREGRGRRRGETLTSPSPLIWQKSFLLSLGPVYCTSGSPEFNYRSILATRLILLVPPMSTVCRQATRPVPPAWKCMPRTAAWIEQQASHV